MDPASNKAAKVTPGNRSSREPGAPLFIALVAIPLVGPLSIHLFLPALPHVRQTFAVSESTAQLTFSLAVVVMAFDESGQADTFERKTEICARSYKILTEKVGFPPEDIIFDPNVFAVATGIEAHNRYGLDFIEATGWIRDNLPHCHISGGVSNVSFSFRGNDAVREAIHTVFLYHAI